MNILFIGDIVGRPGRNAVKQILPQLKEDLNLDLVIANGENLSAGSGITYRNYEEMLKAGIDYFTSGNHIWSKKEFVKYLDESDIKVIRPANYPDTAPGRGYAEIKVGTKKVIIINLLGQVFTNEPVDNPFVVVDKILQSISDSKEKIVLIDFHAEATSEKVALGHFLNGRVSAIVGTHTHIPTADCRVLSKGTAYISDIGMAGLLDSVIGVDTESIKQHFLTGLPFKLNISSGQAIMSAALIKIDPKTGRAKDIELIQEISQ